MLRRDHTDVIKGVFFGVVPCKLFCVGGNGPCVVCC